MKITKWRKNDREGSCLGFFSIEYNDGYGVRFINGLTLMRNRDGHQFISNPSREYQDEGVKKYAAYTGYVIRLDSDKFQEAVLNALAVFFREGATTTPPMSQNAHQSSGNGQETTSEPQYRNVHAQVQNKSTQNDEVPF